MITSGCVRLSTMQQRRRRRRGIGWWQGCEARKLGAGVGADTGGVGVQAIATVKFLWWGVGLMNDILDVILVNRCNQSDEFRTVLPAKMCVRVLLILMLAAAAMLVVGAGVAAGAELHVYPGESIQDATCAAEAGIRFMCMPETVGVVAVRT